MSTATRPLGSDSSALRTGLGALGRHGRQGGIVVGFLVLCVVLAALAPGFLSFGNATNIGLQAAINAVLAMALTFVIVTGGIDLSVGSILALAGVIGADLMNRGAPVPLAAVAALVVGTIAGTLNGVLVQRFRLAPFIVTLGTLSVYRGLALLYSGGQPIYGLPEGFRDIIAGTVLGIPVPVLIAAAVAFAAHAVLRHTRLGEYALALGGNREAARLSGINVGRVTVSVYAISGLLSAIAALILIARLGAAEPIAGQSYELYAIAAAVMGGASLMGGRGSIVGTVFGALVISTLQTGLTLLNVQAFWQLIAIGAVVILAVMADRVEARRDP